jgi:hypothetical protein
MTEDKLYDLRMRVERLARLLDQWEPGIFLWNGAVNDAWWDVVQWAPEAAKQRMGVV